MAPGDAYSSFYEYIVHVLDRSLEKIIIKPNSQFPRNVWFDDECKNLKSKLHLWYKQFRSDDSTSHAEHDSIIELEREYKRTTQREKREFQENVLRRLEHVEELDSSGPSEYWWFWKSL